MLIAISFLLNSSARHLSNSYIYNSTTSQLLFVLLKRRKQHNGNDFLSLNSLKALFEVLEKTGSLKVELGSVCEWYQVILSEKKERRLSTQHTEISLAFQVIVRISSVYYMETEIEQMILSDKICYGGSSLLFPECMIKQPNLPNFAFQFTQMHLKNSFTITKNNNLVQFHRRNHY